MDDSSRQHLLQARYGAQAIPSNLIWNPQIEHMIRHRSVRTFLQRPLPDGALDTMVAAAQSASTGSALHHWSLIAITDPARKQELAALIAATVPVARIPWIEEASALLLWVADASRSAAITRSRGDTPVGLAYLDALLMATIDTSLAAQNAALAAESLGLGVVFLGVMRNAAAEVARIVGLPDHSFIPFGMAVGHPDPARAPQMRPRPAQPMVLHHNHYDDSTWQQYLDDYEAAYRAFRETSRMQPRTWQDAVHTAATSMAYMGGREHLREFVQSRGFELK